MQWAGLKTFKVSRASCVFHDNMGRKFSEVLRHYYCEMTDNKIFNSGYVKIVYIDIYTPENEQPG